MGSDVSHFNCAKEEEQVKDTHTHTHTHTYTHTHTHTHTLTNADSKTCMQVGSKFPRQCI